MKYYVLISALCIMPIYAMEMDIVDQQHEKNEIFVIPAETWNNPKTEYCWLAIIPVDIQNYITSFLDDWPDRETDEQFKKRLRNSSPSRLMLKNNGEKGNIYCNNVLLDTYNNSLVLIDEVTGKVTKELFKGSEYTKNLKSYTNEIEIAALSNNKKSIAFVNIFKQANDVHHSTLLAIKAYHCDTQKENNFNFSESFEPSEGNFLEYASTNDKYKELVKKGYSHVANGNMKLFVKKMNALALSNNAQSVIFATNCELYLVDMKTKLFTKIWNFFASNPDFESQFLEPLFFSEWNWDNFSYIENLIINKQETKAGLKTTCNKKNTEELPDKKETIILVAIPGSKEPASTLADYFRKRLITFDWNAQAKAWNEKKQDEWWKNIKQKKKKTESKLNEVTLHENYSKSKQDCCIIQ